MFRFARPDVLYFLGLIPLLLILLWFVLRQRRKRLATFSSSELLHELAPDISYARPIIKGILLALALAFIIIGIAGPLSGSKLQEVKREGIELIIALDVSNSMLAQDIQPNRLERAKQAVARVTEKMSNDKIGLVVFAGDAYIQLPVTTDYAAARLFLSSVNTNMVPRQGTAIGSAIDLAVKSFTDTKDMKKAIIVITDGENHEDDAIQAAREAANKGILVYTLGMGLPKGAPVPDNSVLKGNYKRDKQGNVIVSKLDESTLQQIAAAGGGIYARASNTQVGLEKLLDALNKLDRTEYEAKIYADYEEQFQYFLFVAMFLLLFDFIILERKNRWFKSFNLFKV